MKRAVLIILAWILILTGSFASASTIQYEDFLFMTPYLTKNSIFDKWYRTGHYSEPKFILYGREEGLKLVKYQCAYIVSDIMKNVPGFKFDYKGATYPAYAGYMDDPDNVLLFALLTEGGGYTLVFAYLEAQAFIMYNNGTFSETYVKNLFENTATGYSAVSKDLMQAPYKLTIEYNNSN